MLETISSVQKFNYSPIHRGINAYKKRADLITKVKTKPPSSSPSVLQSRCKSPDSSWLMMAHQQENTIGIIGGLSAMATLTFLEKLEFWSSRNAEKHHVPFIVCSDPAIIRKNNNNIGLQQQMIAENLLQKRLFLEESGAGCIVMPCHMSHLWYPHVSRGCSVPFLDVSECVARELKEANLKPVEGGRSNVRIGVLAAADSPLLATFYHQKLHSQGLECILADKPTREHMVIPMMEALKQKDMEGARNLLRIAVQVLLVRGVNLVILAADEFQGLLPCDDPLLNKCIDPMDALARSAIKWALHKSKPIIIEQ
ncbi:PREDICTED: uncharacterized protein LOC109179499 [Ipomoea nil]|uniref:uncharacterized protein LOC109179499 n=1 Tax=Ipomoea nil TaxID=35883 RepID=UPI000900DC99|nr:PREDICTED: uncharacterized protein LOC109179499 [Ipomoea nil]